MISFEPLKEPFKKLEELKVIWGDRLILVNKGLGARESRKKIYFNKESLSHASFVKEISNLSYISNHREEEVLVTTLDNFIEQNSINSPIDYIKIDCEGYEMQILQGGEDTIKHHKPIIVVEQKLHTDTGITKETQYGCVDLLKSWGARELGRVRNDCILGW